MREVAWWTIPGLIVIGPLALLLGRWQIAPAWPVWLVAAPALGCVLHQSVRCWFEARGNGFRNPQRGALGAIIERGGLAQRADAGDLAYQAYEIVFYEQTGWQAVRDHAHRCWHYILSFWTITLACALGAGFGALAVLAGSTPVLAALYVIALPPAGLILWKKGKQTHAALELFDRSLVLTHWPLYAAALSSLLAGGSQTASDPLR